MNVKENMNYQEARVFLAQNPLRHVTSSQGFHTIMEPNGRLSGALLHAGGQPYKVVPHFEPFDPMFGFKVVTVQFYPQEMRWDVVLGKRDSRAIVFEAFRFTEEPNAMPTTTAAQDKRIREALAERFKGKAS